MPQRLGAIPAFKPSKDAEVEWNTFQGGWNTFSRPTELKDNELTQADNLMLVGRGVPTGRWGTTPYFLAGEAGRVRLLDAFYVGGVAASLASTNYLLAITDSGYLVRKSGASYAIVTGSSFASGVNYQGVELGLNYYIASASLPFIRFDGTNLIPYIGLSIPTNVSVAALSSASGFTTFGWRVTALSQTGETLGSISKTLASLPIDLTQTSIKVSWNTVSASSGVLRGYNIYRGIPGNESFLAFADPTSIQFIDSGQNTSSTILPPLRDSTSGIAAKYITKYQDRTVLGGVIGDPSRVYTSARYPYHDKYNASDGGNYAYVSPDDGDDVTGLGVSGNQSIGAVNAGAVIVFKNNAVHRMQFGTQQIGNFLILDPIVDVLTNSNGCSSADSIIQVENDTFYFGRKGLYVIGQEPNFLNQIRTNELSARIRPYIQSLSDTDFKEAAAGYIDNKYILSFPSRKETIIYDRERLSFMGPWKTPFGITKWFRYIDATGTERWLAGTDDTYVQEFSTSYISDNGTSIAKTLRTKKTDFGNWSIFKVLKYFNVLFRNVRGSVTVNLRIEDRTGNTVTTKSFSITSSLGNSGWGADPWGSQPWGQSSDTVTVTGDELVRQALIYKNLRVVQVEVISTAANANFEFLGLRMTAQGLGENSLPASVRV